MSGTPALPAAEVLFGRMADAVYLLEPLTSRIVWANRAGWTMLGLSPEEVLDHSVLSLQKDVVGAPQWGDIAAVIRTQSPYVFVGRHRHRDGHEVPVEVVTTCFLLGEQEYFLSVARDVTRRQVRSAAARPRAGRWASASAPRRFPGRFPGGLIRKTGQSFDAASAARPARGFIGRG